MINLIHGKHEEINALLQPVVLDGDYCTDFIRIKPSISIIKRLIESSILNTKVSDKEKYIPWNTIHVENTRDVTA